MNGRTGWGDWWPSALVPAPEESGAPPLLEPDEPPPFEIVNPTGQANALLICDHASNRLPRRLGRLGLTDDQLQQHIAWDPGAAAVARGLSARLDVPLILGGYSRLAIDLNRPLASPELIAAESAGVRIPGNQGLSAAQRNARLAALFLPYHQAIAEWLDEHPNPELRLISLHSFTPWLAGQLRPWSVGLAYGRDPRLAQQLRPLLAQQADLLVGDNQPYGIEDRYDFTLPTHGEGRGIPHVMIEIRQDGLQTQAQIARWVERLACIC
ncbi:N-formylglutamate amidohydrolase [Lamprobacter modestohalophilus]|uniref:N-formylglutamate amidohydrolase n=1 Tax=Lamprobacter modestohalophilus TaxID=1064514 RepID=UPI002ADED658|nr:N-formylglutamate amidohydrolase [Lamprobacter modestohalophilus]MEA1049489.1 N-formylglutamate amidohydrolase [Lamprobacter modestohalophilus]